MTRPESERQLEDFRTQGQWTDSRVQTLPSLTALLSPWFPRQDAGSKERRQVGVPALEVQPGWGALVRPF